MTETSQLCREMIELKAMMLAMQHRTMNNHKSGGNNVQPTTTLYSQTPAAEALSQPFLSPSFNQNTVEITDNQSRLYSFQHYQLQPTTSSSHPSNASPATISHPEQNTIHFNIGTNQYEVPGNFNNHIVTNLYTPPAVEEKIITKPLKAEYVDFDTLPTSIPTIDQQLIGIQVISEDNFNITTHQNPKTKSQISHHGCVHGILSHKQHCTTTLTNNMTYFLTKTISAIWSEDSNLRHATTTTKPNASKLHLRTEYQPQAVPLPGIRGTMSCTIYSLWTAQAISLLVSFAKRQAIMHHTAQKSNQQQKTCHL